MRIAIVNRARSAVDAIRKVIVSTGEHQVAWVAFDGALAVRSCARDKPDLILMGLVMPGMDGVEATRRIMARTPCSIVVVTGSVKDNSSKIFEAMGAGALDVANTPVLDRPNASKCAAALLAKIDTIRKFAGIGKVGRSSRALPPPAHRDGSYVPCLVAIGASAGGPTALAAILAGLPSAFPAPIVVIQHVDTQFAQGLADWLGGQCRLRVRLAKDGDRPQPGTVLLAGCGQHLVLSNPLRLTYSRHPADSSYLPSIDVFLESVDQYWRGAVVGVLLTGMGCDGARGLSALHRHGHHTIAQDQGSSAVYGMPKAAAELRAVTEILPLERIGPRLAGLLAKKSHAHD
jgi:two-component system, chemotaxis family, response regulator WspF